MSVKPEVRLKRLLANSPLKMLALAESCTGGLVAARVTSVPGSSAYFDRGFVVYTDAAKTELLGVGKKLLASHGAVSEETARALVDGIFKKTKANIAGAVTGVAGPDGDTPGKPVGTVWIAWGTREKVDCVNLKLYGQARHAIRKATADALLSRLCETAQK